MMAEKNIQMNQKNGTEWDLLYPKTKAELTVLNDGKTVQAEITGINTTLENKVDKVEGKQLSTNDYTTTEKNKLAGLKDHTSEISTINTTLGNKVDKITGKGLSTNDYTTTEKNKLADLKDHSGEISSINTTLENKVDKVAGKQLSTNDYTTNEKNKLAGLYNIPVSSTEPTDSSVVMWFQEL